MSLKKSEKLLFISLIILSLIKTTISVCNTSNCPPSRGDCISGQCKCKNNYATIDNSFIKSNGISCNYRLKSSLMALLLELFFPFGVGHLYSGKTLLAIIKFLLFLFLLSIFCSLLCCVIGKVVNACTTIIFVIVILSLIGLVFMEVFDIISYLLGFYRDGNGVNMMFYF